jgi:hypothetical protein
VTFSGGHGWTADYIRRQHDALVSVRDDLAAAVRD